MATKFSTKLSNGLLPSPRGSRTGLISTTATFSVGAGGSLSAGDVIQMVGIPAGAAVVYLGLSGGSGDALVSCGDGVSAARYLAAATMGSNAPSVRTITLHAANTPYVYSTDDTIDLTVGTVSVGTITGGFHLTCIFSMDPL